MANAKGTRKGASKRDSKKSSLKIPAATTKSKSVNKAIQIFEQKLENGEVKPTVGVYMRLLELQKEIDGDEPREIKVTWVEPGETESSSEE